ncbi:MAG: hypothetical protein DHS20C15_19410 [Planctomycetota bacterium]|nr:MAG: hypothetical protein DHS20C15_19410 [Planctomycetota bacterium]
MGALFDWFLSWLIDDVLEVVICGAGRLVFRLFGRRTRIPARHEGAIVWVTGLAVWAAIGFGIWWLLR